MLNNDLLINSGYCYRKGVKPNNKMLIDSRKQDTKLYVCNLQVPLRYTDNQPTALKVGPGMPGMPDMADMAGRLKTYPLFLDRDVGEVHKQVV